MQIIRKSTKTDTKVILEFGDLFYSLFVSANLSFGKAFQTEGLFQEKNRTKGCHQLTLIESPARKILMIPAVFPVLPSGVPMRHFMPFRFAVMFVKHPLTSLHSTPV
mmetsp:Transcript_60249/g.89376  ORF Transcript_60249/g.89376 Transcript_60249/m.89376 type:complete len:107 (-) Transcript_60249:100-420(-)